MRYTIIDKRVIRAKDLSKVITWVNSAYDFHEKHEKTHRWSYFNALRNYSRKGMKKNVKSSTETDLIGVNEYIPYNF